jgi:UDP-N-acetylmuramate--alanine ligase
VSLRVPGRHSVLNSLAALAVADLAGASLDAAAESLGAYKGAARRFEFKGEKRGTRFFDDYAHNPAKIRAALNGARHRFPVGNIWAVWQPHTFSRTLALIDEFSASFVDADHVLVLPVYAAREKAADFGRDADRCNTISLAREVMKHHKHVHPVSSIEDAAGMLFALMRPGDVIITLSAGDGNQVIERVMKMP